MDKTKQKYYCIDCEKRIHWSTALYGQKRCKSCAKSGELNSSFKTGKVKHKIGYILVCSPKHPFRNVDNYVYEHRLVMEKHLDRYLSPEEIVHHKNGLKMIIELRI